jgi:hypothetical protein
MHDFIRIYKHWFHMKKTLTLSMLIFSFFSMYAQRFNWSNNSGYPGINNSYYGAVDISTDDAGNVYTFDYANSDQMCENQTIPISSNGYNLFLYKFSPSGSLVWGKAFGPGLGGSIVTPMNLEIGPDNKIYALAHINGPNIVAEDTTFNITGPSNVIVCIDTEGEIEWTYAAQYSCPNCSMLEIVNEKIYFQGGNTRINSIDLNQQPASELNYFFASGTATMGIIFQGSGHFSNGELLFAGLQRGNSSFIEGDTLFQVDNPFLYCNITYLRTNVDLEPIWADTYGYLRDPETHFIPVTVDANDQIYTGWEVLNDISIAGTSIEGDFNAYAGAILSMDSAGNPLWLRELVSPGPLKLSDLYADSESGKIWITGTSSTPTTAGDSTMNPNVNGSPIIVSFNASGEFIQQTAATLPPASQGQCIEKGAGNQFILGGKLPNASNYTLNCVDYTGAKGLFLAGFLDIPVNPPTPEILTNGEQLSASPEFSGNIQWFLNGNPIEGANTLNYTASADGNYTVEFSYDFGCTSAASSEIVFVSTAIHHSENPHTVLYPNPASNWIKLPLLSSKSAEVKIFTLNGQLVRKLQSQNGFIQIEDLNAGFYILEWPSEKGYIYSKFAKQ